MLLTLLGTVFSSVMAGGATGLLGIAIQRFADYFNKAQDIKKLQLQYDFELAKRKADADIMREEWAGRTKVAEAEAAGKAEVAASEAFAASFKTEPQRYSDGARYTKNQAWLMVALDFIRGIVRPGLTVYLCAITTVIYNQVTALLKQYGPALTVDQANSLIITIIGTILYLTTTCVLWWFGTRNTQSPPKQAA